MEPPAGQSRERYGIRSPCGIGARTVLPIKADVDDAISGRVIQGTQNRNGSTGGTLRATSGVQVAERRLRLMIVCPSTMTNCCVRRMNRVKPMSIHWDSVMHEALSQRPNSVDSSSISRNARWNCWRHETSSTQDSIPSVAIVSEVWR